MKAEIIALGSELTCGARLDTNSQWLSRELEALGWKVQRHTTVADDLPSMVQIFREAAHRSRLVLITGGLGPTLDDITRETLAEAFDQPLVEDPDALQHITTLFRSRGREMPERNRVQALRPRDAITVHNAHGTAPGILMHLQNPACTLGVMPGVPSEMRLMFQEQLVAMLPPSSVFVSRTVIRTFGYGESDAERLLGDLTARGRNPEVGITASQAVISLSVTARADNRQQCDQLCQQVRRQILERLGHAVFGEGDVELHTVAAEMLMLSNRRVALLEGTSTGGQIAQWLTESDKSARQVAFSQVLPCASSAFSPRDSPGDNGPEEKAAAGLRTSVFAPPDGSRSSAGSIGSFEANPNSSELRRSGDWDVSLRPRAQQMLADHEADFVILTSPSRIATDDRGIRLQVGEVLLLGRDLECLQDVSMTGDLAIFRTRAARTALNLLRLHLQNSR